MNLLISISRNIYKLDQTSVERASSRWDELIHPPKSLGELEKIVERLSGIYGNPNIEDSPKKCILAFGADNGVYEEGVSPHPQEITRLQFENFVNGKCAVANLAKFNNTDVIGVDVGIKGDTPIENIRNYKIREGTDNIAKGPAMSMDEAVKAIEIGIEVAEFCIVDGYKIIGVGEMGISNTTTSAAILTVMSGMDPMDIVDTGAGLEREKLKLKADVIRRAIEINNPNPTDGIEVLSKVGGFDIGAIAGVILGCAANRVPVVLDGFISYAGALIAYKINPRSMDYVIPSHISGEKGSKEALEMLGLKPMINLGMKLGEGTGAALCMNIIDSAIYTYNHMAKFEDEMLGRFLKENSNKKMD